LPIILVESSIVLYLPPIILKSAWQMIPTFIL